MSDNIDTTSAPANSTDASGAPAGADVEALKNKANENWERYVRLAAEFDNFKKRAAREREDAIRYANQALIAKVLPVLDNFEMALAAATNTPGENTGSLQTGVNMILSQLKAVLAEAGVEEIDATGQMFNPTLHEAVSQQVSSTVPEGQVVQQLRKGYKLRDRLLRAATVVVAKAPAVQA